MTISFELNKESDIRFKWRRVWKNILDSIKYSSSKVQKFSNLGMKISLSISYPLVEPV